MRTVSGGPATGGGGMSFHVPEPSRITTGPMGSAPQAGFWGAFDVESCEPGWRLAMIATDGDDPDCPEAHGWEHVSVHAYRPRTGQMRTPNWREMCQMKDLFWDGEDVVMQLHPRRSEYVNQHPHVLHLWRPTHVELPTPPKSLVGAT